MMMIGMNLGFGRRQLHTITSREIIKPSSPTPSHLRTYNLSQLDQAIPHMFMPMILYYPNDENSSLTPDDKAEKIKKSLSQSLTQYYPFAGRLHTPASPYVECNDEGVVFVEAKHDCQLDKFQSINVEDLNPGQIFADDMVWQNSPYNTSLVGVQLNHFACGGIGLAVSMSHRIGDARSLGSYLSHWASVAHYGSTDHKEVLPFNPHFIQSPTTVNPHQLETSILNTASTSRVTRKFVFPNSKLSDLKNKVLALAEAGSLSINNPTRVELLTALIYKTAMAAKSSSLKPSYLFIPMDMRMKVVPKLPETAVGNLVSIMMVMPRSEHETSLSSMVSHIQKEKMEFGGVQSMQQVSQRIQSSASRMGNEDTEKVGNDIIWCSSIRGFPFNKVNFGWGNPTQVGFSFGYSDRSGIVLIDPPNGDGIEARVTLEPQEMAIFQNDKELLSFCQNN